MRYLRVMAVVALFATAPTARRRPGKQKPRQPSCRGLTRAAPWAGLAPDRGHRLDRPAATLGRDGSGTGGCESTGREGPAFRRLAERVTGQSVAERDAAPVRILDGQGRKAQPTIASVVCCQRELIAFDGHRPGEGRAL